MAPNRKQTANGVSKTKPRKSSRLASQMNAKLQKAQTGQSPEPSPEPPSTTATESGRASSGHPLFLDPEYENTGPGEWTLRDIKPQNVEVNDDEKNVVREFIGLMLQASRVLHTGPEPEPLDNGGDIIWDWQSRRITSNAYDKLIYVLKNHDTLRWSAENLCYDWIPDEADGGTISIRKKCNFQSRFTRVLASEIGDAVDKTESASDLNLWSGLEPQQRASVLVGNKLGMRSPCRCFKRYREGEDNRVQWFILEVGIAEKSKVLPEIARSYIERGTLCVMTADIQRGHDYGFTVAYTLYRRGEKTSETAEGVARYEVVKSAKGLLSEDPLRSLDLTLWDFYPAAVLEEHGVTDSGDPRAGVELSCEVLRKCLENTWNSCENYVCESTFSQEMEQLERLLED